MRRRSFLQLLTQRSTAPDRIFFHSIWFKGHNNPRYAALLRRLEKVDAHLVQCSDRWPLRGLQFRILFWSRRVRYGIVLALAAKRYGALFTCEPEQVPHFSGPVIVDVDDPKFSTEEVALLSAPNVRAYVVTAERTAERYREMGLSKPSIEIPQGVDLSGFSADQAEKIRLRHKGNDGLVVGYVASWLLTDGDPDGRSPMYNVDHLLELWRSIQAGTPKARLWLIGQPSKRVQQMCSSMQDLWLTGRVKQQSVPNFIANFDIALYPRTVDQGIRAVKVAEYMALGIPTVSYNLEVVSDLRKSGGGIVVETASEFVDAVVALAADSSRRQEIGAAAKSYAETWNWDQLGLRYENEVFGTYLMDYVATKTQALEE